MVKIKFQSMTLLDDGHTVKIIGDNTIEIELSILQLAKVFEKDKKVLEELKEKGFGSEELEDACEETRKMISNFPNIPVTKNEINCGDASVRDNINSDREIVLVMAEDICGWGNEGIRIKFPKEIYLKELKDKKFEMILKQKEIELKTAKNINTSEG